MDTQYIAKATSACLCPPSLLLAKQVPGNVHTIEVHDVRTGTFELAGHAAPIGAVGACSHQEQLALSGAGDGAVKLWCLASRECRLTLMQSPVSSVCFVGQRQVAVGCLDSVVKVNRCFLCPLFFGLAQCYCIGSHSTRFLRCGTWQRAPQSCLTSRAMRTASTMSHQRPMARCCCQRAWTTR